MVVVVVVVVCVCMYVCIGGIDGGLFHVVVLVIRSALESVGFGRVRIWYFFEPQKSTLYVKCMCLRM